jgi:hypothetical protein
MGDEISWNAPIATSALCLKQARSSLSALKKGSSLPGGWFGLSVPRLSRPAALTRKSDGLPVGAVSGYCNMLWKLLEDMKGPEQPTHLAVIFDAGEKTFRNALYKEYKANRPPPPEDLIPQFPLVRDATRAFGISCVEMAGYEADDLIATYARLAREAGARCTIISSDKDLMQLVVDGKVELLDTMKNRRRASAEVMEKFGVTPDKVVQSRRWPAIRRQCPASGARRQDRRRADQYLAISKPAARRRDNRTSAARPDRECGECPPSPSW